MPSVSDSLVFRNFEAWVEIENERVPCYAPFVLKKDKEATCWIASEAGKCISININRTEPPTFSFAVTAYVDGDTIRSHAVKRPAESYLVNFNAVTTSDVTERGLMFAPMTLTDDEDYNDLGWRANTNEEVGEIILVVHRVVNVKICRVKVCRRGKKARAKPLGPIRTREQLPLEKIVHESSTKGKNMHCVGYGEPVAIEPVGKTTDGWDEKEVLATFIFKYHKLDVLKKAGLVPETPAPPPVHALTGQPDPLVPEFHNARIPEIITDQPDSPDDYENMYASPPRPQSSAVEDDLPSPDVEEDVLDDFPPPLATELRQANGTQNQPVTDEGVERGLSAQPLISVTSLLQGDTDAMDCENESHAARRPCVLGRPTEIIIESTVAIKEEDIETGGLPTQTIILTPAKKEEVSEDAAQLQLYDAEEDRRREGILLAELEELRIRRTKMDKLRESNDAVGSSSHQSILKREHTPLSVYFAPGEVFDLSIDSDSDGG